MTKQKKRKAREYYLIVSDWGVRGTYVMRASAKRMLKRISHGNPSIIKVREVLKRKKRKV